MAVQVQGVVLVGHGGIPTDCPPELVAKLKRLEGQRRAGKLPMSAEERDVDAMIRRWPRTKQTDPYQYGLEALAHALQPLLKNVHFAVAYNEFCAPTLEEAVEGLIQKGAMEITVATTMFTPGGSHSEIEIPEIISRLQERHPGVEIRYAWPFDLERIARALAEQIQRFSCADR